MKAKNKPNFTTGPLFFRIFFFVVPIMLTGILQVAYNMADHIVVGRYSGDADALAAVGSTSALTTLIVNFLMGLATGGGIVVAQFVGAKREKEVSTTVHTSMCLSVIGGILFMLIGLLVSEPALILMKTKDDILVKAVLYIRIICAGIPASAVYNFGAAILRSVGDSKTPLFILTASGITNVLFNFLFVVGCGMAVEGVAIATIISQYLSAIAVVVVLINRKGNCYALIPKNVRINKNILLRILRFGVPTGIQSSLFAVTNVFITSAANVFDKTVVSAKTIAANVDNIVFVAVDGYQHAAMTFIGQNRGADKNERISRSLWYLLSQVTAVGILTGAVLRIFGTQVASLFMPSDVENKAAVISYALDIMKVMLSMYFLCGIFSTLSGALRALDFSMFSMVASLVGLVVRTIWVLAIFPLPQFKTVERLYWSYPISWSISIMCAVVMFVYVWRKLEIGKKARAERAQMKLKES